MADRVSARRERMNAFFITAISALTAVAVLTHDVLKDTASAAIFALIPSVAALICLLWALLIRSYRTLNQAKWAVIGMIEDQLPLRPFAAEYEQTKTAGHRSFTLIEQWVPALLGVLFVALAVFFALRA